MQPFTISPQKELFDLSYQSQKEKLDLHIQLDKSFLYVSRFHEKSHQYLSLKCYNFKKATDWNQNLAKIQAVVKDIEPNDSSLLQLSFTDTLYTLVPAALFEEDQLASYLSFNHPVNDFEDLELAFNRLPKHEIVIVYAIPGKVKAIFQDHFLNFKQHHFSFPLIESFLTNETAPEQACLHIQAERFELMIKKENQLQYFNSFDYTSAEDLLYYLLFVIEQLQIDREEMPMKLYGEFEKHSTLYDLLHRYIRKLEIGKRPAGINFSKVLDQVPEQYYHLLFNQYLCE